MKVIPVIMVLADIKNRNTGTVDTLVPFKITQGIVIIETVTRNVKTVIHTNTSSE